MKLRPHRKQAPELSLAPLIDVVFLLLIFFMVSTTFDREGRVKLQLPEASSTVSETAEAERIEIGIDPMGNYSIDQRQLEQGDSASIRERLQMISGGDRRLTVVIRADASTPHRFVVRAMDAAAQLGLTRISIATLLSDDAAAPTETR